MHVWLQKDQAGEGEDVFQQHARLAEVRQGGENSHAKCQHLSSPRCLLQDERNADWDAQVLLPMPMHMHMHQPMPHVYPAAAGDGRERG